MLNELKAFADSLKMWNMELTPLPHYKVTSNSNGKGFLVELSPGGVRRVSEFPLFEDRVQGSQLKTVWKNNFAYAFTFKFSSEKSIAALIVSTKGHIAYTLEVARALLEANKQRKWLDDGRQLSVDSLRSLIQILEKLDLKVFVEKVHAELKKHGKSKDTYVCLELAGANFFIQHGAFFNAVSEMFKRSDEKTSSIKDVFGNPLSIDGESVDGVISKLKVDGLGMVPIYARNRDNGCFSIFGRKSTELCQVGRQTIQQFNEIINFVFDGSRKSYVVFDDKTKKPIDVAPGTWYQFIDETSKQNRDKAIKRLVLSCIYPHDSSVIDLDYSDMTEEAWEFRSQSVIQGLRKQSKVTPNGMGHVIVICQAKGAWHVESSRSFTLKQAVQHVELWSDGFKNGCQSILPGVSRLSYPSVSTIVRLLNRSWSIVNNEPKFVPAKRVKIQDAYELLFDNPVVIDNFARLFGQHIAPFMVRALNKSVNSSKFYLLRQLVPFRNLLLHKLKCYYKDETMEHWAFKFGELLQLSDSIYWHFFDQRNCDQPAHLIGGRYAENAFRSGPRMALFVYRREFQKCLAWLKRQSLNPDGRSSAYLWWKYRDCEKSMNELLGGNEMPIRFSPKESMLFSAGYSNFTFRKKDQGEQNVQEQPST